jgi:hypothetical protein
VLVFFTAVWPEVALVFSIAVWPEVTLVFLLPYGQKFRLSFYYHMAGSSEYKKPLRKAAYIISDQLFQLKAYHFWLFTINRSPLKFP